MMCHIKSLTSKETVWVSNRTRCSNCHSCNGSFGRQASFSPPRSILFFCCYGLNGFAAASSANPSLLVTSMANFPPPQQPPRPTLPSVFHPIFPWTSDREKREERRGKTISIKLCIITTAAPACLPARVQTDPRVFVRRSCSLMLELSYCIRS